jgi:ABC-type lipopolysaccharide export system ATPase subunit
VTGAILEVEYLHAGYDGAAVLRNLTLSAAPGEIVALLGANGAGKTTTLYAISGIVRPMKGRILLDGRDTAHISPSQVARLGVAHVPEGRGIFYGLTPRQATPTSPHSPSCATALQGYCPAASSRCWRSPARCCAGHRCFCSTS